MDLKVVILLIVGIVSTSGIPIYPDPIMARLFGGLWGSSSYPEYHYVVDHGHYDHGHSHGPGYHDQGHGQLYCEHRDHIDHYDDHHNLIDHYDVVEHEHRPLSHHHLRAYGKPISEHQVIHHSYECYYPGQRVPPSHSHHHVGK